MNNKEINDLVSFIAMVATDGYDKAKIEEWLNTHPLPKEVKVCVDNILISISSFERIG